MACNYSMRFGDKEYDSIERLDSEEVGEGRAGGAGVFVFIRLAGGER